MQKYFFFFYNANVGKDKLNVFQFSMNYSYATPANMFDLHPKGNTS